MNVSKTINKAPGVGQLEAAPARKVKGQPQSAGRHASKHAASRARGADRKAARIDAQEFSAHVNGQIVHLREALGYGGLGVVSLVNPDALGIRVTKWEAQKSRRMLARRPKQYAYNERQRKIAAAKAAATAKLQRQANAEYTAQQNAERSAKVIAAHKTPEEAILATLTVP